MNYSAYYPVDSVNGEGIRCVLFVSGCSHGCEGCYNKSTWNPNTGWAFTKTMEDKIIQDLKSTSRPLAGITLSGGDPLHRRNRETILALCKRIRSECPGKTIWLYTGYTHSQLTNEPILDYIDVLVDGKFEKELADPSLAFRGSANQQIIRLNV
jgi:anaerobic ribonucleoside-triphosphate reductase activating protein